MTTTTAITSFIEDNINALSKSPITTNREVVVVPVKEAYSWDSTYFYTPQSQISPLQILTTTAYGDRKFEEITFTWKDSGSSGNSELMKDVQEFVERYQTDKNGLDQRKVVTDIFEGLKALDEFNTFTRSNEEDMELEIGFANFKNSPGQFVILTLYAE